MVQRAISEIEVRHVIATGEIVEDYPNDTPYPSVLVLGWSDRRLIHVVVADNVDDQENIVITVYEPDPAGWGPDFKRRRPMKCVICKKDETKPGTATVTLDKEGATLVFKGVPARVCANCGEEYIDENITASLLKSAGEAAQLGIQVEVRQYSTA